MSKRSLLNVTSRKKRDTMLNFTNITAASQQGGASYIQGPSIITGGYVVPNPILFCATGRAMDTNAAGNRGNVTDEATRTASTCYMKGISEAVEIQINDNLPWQWRRICFTYKGLNASMPATTGFGMNLLTSSGQKRTSNMLPNNAYRDTLSGLLFKGRQNSDWDNFMTAPTDSSRVTIKYDRTRTIASGNEGGVIRKYKFWHGMNKNLVYDDDENGGDEDVQFYSNQGKAGMGDYFIVDLFLPRIGSTGSNQLSFQPEATLYWHEK